MIKLEKIKHLKAIASDGRDLCEEVGCETCERTFSNDGRVLVDPGDLLKLCQLAEDAYKLKLTLSDIYWYVLTVEELSEEDRDIEDEPGNYWGDYLD